jgi:hypothetical protein
MCQVLQHYFFVLYFLGVVGRKLWYTRQMLRGRVAGKRYLRGGRGKQTKSNYIYQQKMASWYNTSAYG